MESLQIIAKNIILFGWALIVLLVILLLVFLVLAWFRLSSGLRSFRSLVKKTKQKSGELFDPLISLSKMVLKSFAEKSKSKQNKEKKS